ncbi:YqgQ family protein [Caryophanon tenue]|uniref:Cytoplasmic protein n=1 Tax=Caryophanon tenue TaxID=33978 RepID=A0A1C0YN36_9BACL|nr:YqgQ family protein [Caryophanon tenue]OCS88590.1 cytoplasmic protein [Caryophanon tenue]
MQNLYDIMQLLKQYGTFIYTTDFLGDLHLMEDEVKELYKSGIMDIKDYQMAMLILRQEATKYEMKKR